MAQLETIDEGVWALAAPQKFLGLHVGTRMSVVRLSTGGLWVHSPVELSEELRAELLELGPVEHVVGPNLYHHLHLGAYVEAFSDAKLHGAPGLAKKRPDLRFDSVLGDAAETWGGEVVPIYIGGTMLHETVFVHPASRSLIATDLIENFESSEHWGTRMYLKLCGVHGKLGVSRPIRLAHRNRARAREAMDRVLGHEFERIVICHGRNVGVDARDKLREAYSWLS